MEEVKKEMVKGTEVSESKPTAKETNKTDTALDEDKTAVGESAPDTEDIDEVLELLNIMDEEVGGKGGITNIPDEMRGSIGYLVDKLNFVRDLFEDPLWKSVMDDLADQKEDGKTPSVEVAIARTIPLEKLQELADTEDYEGAQSAVADNLAQTKAMEDEEAVYEANFNESQKAGEEYAADMGYDEEQKNELFQMVLDLFKIMGDGKLTKEEFEKVDKMRTFDTVTKDLQEQISTRDAKEVLPDQASMEATNITQPPKRETPTSTPGMASLGNLTGTTDFLKTGKNRYNK